MRAPRGFLMKKASLLLAMSLFVGVAIMGAEGSARADSPFDGSWRQGPLREDFTVQQWLAGCGPAPQSGSSGGGETVKVTQEGDELSFVGGGRVYKTNACYDQIPTLVRSTHQRDASGRSWRTNCTTPDGDPRRTLLQTLVVATSDSHIDVIETGRYEVILSDGRCIADVRRSRGFDLIKRDGADPVPSAAPAVTAAPVPTVEKPAPPRVDCSSPGEPARLEVRPSRKLLRTGESFAFRGVVVDGQGCGTGQNVTFALANAADSNKLTVEPSGRVSISAGATLGTAELIASAAGKSTRVTVEVTSPSQYDELLARSGLNSKGENENAAITIIATQTIGGGEARAEDSGAKRRLVFGAIVGGLALALSIVWFVVFQRSKRAKKLEAELEERHAERVRIAEGRRKAQRDKYESDLQAHEASKKAASEALAKQSSPPGPIQEVLTCSACKREYPPGSLFCPHDGNRLQPASEAKSLSAGSICPACKRGFDPGKKVCPFDGEELIPYAAQAAQAGASDRPAHAKICPTCGGRFEGGAAFCGKDGTALVLLN
jgi:uncharacterized protein YbaR (Trm112 family)